MKDDKKKIGLFFGSFNPVHIGHMIIANHMVNNTDLDQVWMVVSPQNPFKERKSLAGIHDRIHLVNLAIGDDNTSIMASDIEIGLPIPSYTIDTLAYLTEKYSHDFALLMGGDNLKGFHKWKNHESILNNHSLYIYRRMNIGVTRFDNHPSVYFVDAPLLDISSTFIRKVLNENKSIQYLVPDTVYTYLKDSNMYRKK